MLKQSIPALLWDVSLSGEKSHHFLFELGPLFGRLERGDESQWEVLLVMRLRSSAALHLTPYLHGHPNFPLPSAVFLDSQQALDCPQTPA